MCLKAVPGQDGYSVKSTLLLFTPIKIHGDSDGTAYCSIITFLMCQTYITPHFHRHMKGAVRGLMGAL